MSAAEERKFTILCLDDEAPILAALRRIFLDEDWVILSTTSAEKGLQMLTSLEVDVVLSDYRMPQMNGVEFLKRAKIIRPECVRIVLSAYADINAVVAALNEGEIYRFLPKPWNDEELLETVRDALQHHDLAARNTTLNGELARLNAELEQAFALRTAELELQRRVTFACELLEALPTPVLGVDPQGSIAFANEAACLFFDQGDRPLIGRQAAEVLPEDLSAAVAAAQAGAGPACVGRETQLRVVGIGAREDTIGVLVHMHAQAAANAAHPAPETAPHSKSPARHKS